MLAGLYLSAQGANAQSLRNDIVANNMANASTTAFKRDTPIFQGHPTFDLRQGIVPKNDSSKRNNATGGISLARVSTDFSTKSHERTGRNYDVALNGPGFLQVRDGSRDLLTRNGRLMRSDFGELVTEDGGLPVLSTAGVPIQIPDTVVGITIGPKGEMNGTDQLGRPVFSNQIEIVETDTTQLEKLGNSMYLPHSPVEPAANAELRQGFVEASGVNPILEMTSMIETTRAFEANINMIRMQDESLGKLLQAVGA